MEISQRKKDRLFQVKYPELSYNSRASRDVCDSLNRDIKNFVNSLLGEMRCDENIKFKLNREVQNKELKVDYNLDVFAENYVSARFTVYTYRGGAHGQTYYKCFNYSAQGAKQLKLNDLLYLKKRSELQSLNNLLQKYFVNPNQCFSDLPSVTSDFQFFSFQKDNFVFSFSDNSLGDYVCGTTEIKIPVWELKQHGLLKL
ncbi:hypothetical protein BZG02_18405 [Labilibaculum filiforme]|uniref:Deacetylase PdaC domain-containing protein n=2 Tax=Labilibaculum filiforme TaxID=1940526 RepID=A0A2N3HRK4_9BACT|nr:hypothetical protein BZG02_18405 [Labilibaculum filiforme]